MFSSDTPGLLINLGYNSKCNNLFKIQKKKENSL